MDVTVVRIAGAVHDLSLSAEGPRAEYLRTVLDWLERTQGVKRVVLMGLCSGADHAVLYAHTDPRIAGLVLMDPTVRPTARYYVHYVLQRLGSLSNWKSLFTGRSGLLRLALRQLRHAFVDRPTPEDLTLHDLPFSPHLRHCYRRAAQRGIRMFTVLTSITVRQTYHRQILDSFPEAALGGALRLEYFRDGDHVFSRQHDRDRLYRVVLDWLGADIPP